MLAAAFLAEAWAQTVIHLPSQGRAADFSAYPQTKPARVVTALPAGCAAGEAVVVAGGGAAGLYVCNSAGAWVAAAPHGHQLNELSGVAGKQGTGTLLQAFGGGAVQAGECAEFDANGNLVSARKPCGGSPNFSLAFTGQTTVVLEHGLGTRSVLAGCVDENERLVIPNRIEVLDENRVQVQFAVPQSGRCVVNANGGGGGGSGAVSSVFGRTGAVTAQAGDYNFSQIGGYLTLNQIAPSALQGNGSKIQLFSGTAAANECAKFDANGNLVSAGAPCGTGNGDVTGPTGAADGELAVFQGTTGKILRRATGSGLVKLTNGVLGLVSGTASQCVRADGSTGPCGGTIFFGAGLEGSGTASDPVRLASGGSVASQAYYAASLTFGSLGAFSCAEQPIPAEGVSAGEAVAAGLPGGLPAGVVGMMYGAADSVVVRLCNTTNAAVAIPDGLTYQARVVRGF